MTPDQVCDLEGTNALTAAVVGAERAGEPNPLAALRAHDIEEAVFVGGDEQTPLLLGSYPDAITIALEKKRPHAHFTNSIAGRSGFPRARPSSKNATASSIRRFAIRCWSGVRVGHCVFARRYAALLWLVARQ